VYPTLSAARYVVLAGGGTAGHVIPALAIAEALVADGRARQDVRFVGARRGIEATMVPAAGYTVELLALRNFPRRISLRLILAAFDQIRALLRCWTVMSRRRAAAVVSVGGYVSAPCVLAAKLRGVPIVAVSYDAGPGLATRLTARIAVLTAVALPGSSLPRARLTGAPVRAAVVSVDRTGDRPRARRQLGLPENRFVILVVGGSLGSGSLNRATEEFVAMNMERGDVAVYHVVGDRNMVPPGTSGEAGIIWLPVGFEAHMELALCACDVVVSRCGASTVAELAVIGVPSILVPWPGAVGDHQRANGRWLADAGAAMLVPDDEWNGARMSQEIEALIGDPARLRTMAEAAASVGRRDGAQAIARLIEEVAR
jgi:UDP-N-acetylglucosamine--N-acetylmuramyl-(pentapeptide) pyrophosphoryl-undecaprenol N-acetylglucosamine transferase